MSSYSGLNRLLIAAALSLSVLLLSRLDASETQGAAAARATIEAGGFLALLDTAVVGATKVWAVSEGGLVLYDGRSWTATELVPLGTELTAIAAHGSDVWVTTDDCSIGRVSDLGFSLRHAPWSCTLADLVVLGPEVVVAVGESEAAAGLIVVYRDGMWTYRLLDAVGGLTSADVAPDGSVWAAGESSIIELHGDLPLVHRDVVPGCLILDVDVAADGAVWLAGKCDPPELFTPGNPFVASYNGSIVERSHLPRSQAWWITDVEMVNARVGWAVGQSYVIYCFDGESWSVCENLRGGVFEALTSIAVVDESTAYFVGSQAVIVQFLRGRFSLYAGQRSFEAPLGDFGLLTGVIVFDDGDGWAVGLGGPPIRRDSETGRWYPVDYVPHAERLVSVAGTNSHDVWFGSYCLGRGMLSVLIHYDGRAFDVYEVGTQLPVWDVQVMPGDSAWAVASSKWSSSQEEPASAILRMAGGHWAVVATIPGEELVALDTSDGDTVTVVGSATFECLHAVCIRKEPIASGFVKNIAFDSGEAGYAVGSDGVFVYGNGAWHRDASFDAVRGGDLPMAVSGDEQCVVVTGRSQAWVKRQGRWRRRDIAVATSVGQFRFEAISTVGQGEARRFWMAGGYGTVVSGQLCLDGDVLETATATYVTPRSGTASPTSAATVPPGETASATPANSQSTAWLPHTLR